MPRKKDMNYYLNDFYNKALKEKYGMGSITPEIYQEELLEYIKKMDPEFAINNIVEFINNSAYDVNDVQDTLGRYLSADSKRLLSPYHFFGNLLVNNSPSKEVYEAMEDNMSKNAYVSYCEKIQNEVVQGTTNSIIEHKINRFKRLEALKPKGNKVSRFFKRLFNINGYNDKMRAYESCKNSIKQLVGDKLTDEEFERHIQDDKHFSSASLKKEVVENVDLSNDLVNQGNQVNNSEVVKVQNEVVSEIQIDNELKK